MAKLCSDTSCIMESIFPPSFNVTSLVWQPAVFVTLCAPFHAQVYVNEDHSEPGQMTWTIWVTFLKGQWVSSTN